MKKLLIISLLAAATTMTGCGGGGDDSNSTSTDTVQEDSMESYCDSPWSFDGVKDYAKSCDVVEIPDVKFDGINFGTVWCIDEDKELCGSDAINDDMIPFDSMVAYVDSKSPVCKDSSNFDTELKYYNRCSDFEVVEYVTLEDRSQGRVYCVGGDTDCVVLGNDGNIVKKTTKADAIANQFVAFDETYHYNTPLGETVKTEHQHVPFLVGDSVQEEKKMLDDETKAFLKEIMDGFSTALSVKGMVDSHKLYPVIGVNLWSGLQADGLTCDITAQFKSADAQGKGIPVYTGCEISYTTCLELPYSFYSNDSCINVGDGGASRFLITQINEMPLNVVVMLEKNYYSSLESAKLGTADGKPYSFEKKLFLTKVGEVTIEIPADTLEILFDKSTGQPSHAQGVINLNWGNGRSDSNNVEYDFVTKEVY